jgi:hypothetical protein
MNKSGRLVRALVLGTGVIAGVAIACSRESGGDLGKMVRRSIRPRSAGAIDLSSPTYKPGALTKVGSLAGAIRLDGPAPADTSRITVDQGVCGTEPPSGVDTTANGLNSVLVWIANASTGKALPIERRVQLTSVGCVLEPRVQATVIGSAVNVFNDDRALHDLVFIDLSSGDTLEVMPFFNSGQVVASDKLARHAGIVEVRCKRHPWTRAYIAVFDHPYYAVTEDGGRFKIDSIPPGGYTMKVWHEGMREPVSKSVNVEAGGARVDLGVKLH